MKKLLAIALCITCCLTLVACGSSPEKPTTQPSKNAAATDPTPAADQPIDDDRGIDGLEAGILCEALEAAPICIPHGEVEPADAENEKYYAAKVSSYTTVDGADYGYVFTTDTDDEIISGAIGVDTDDASDAMLYFACVIMAPNDSQDIIMSVDDAWALGEDAVNNADEDGYEFTVGIVKYTAYAAGNSYQLTFTKA